jgi:hypothetical protein
MSRSLGTRLDHSQHRKAWKFGTQRVQSMSRGRIVSDYKSLDPYRHQSAGSFQCIGADRCGAFGSIGKAGCVAQIDQGLVGKSLAKGF